MRCPGAPGGRHGALGASAALYARNDVAAPRRRARWWFPGGGGAVAVDGGVGSAEEDEAEMTSSMACAIAASSASALGKQTWPGPPCRTKGSGGRGWGGGAACRSTEDGAVVVAAGVTATVRWSDVETSAAGLPTETDGREDDGDDGRVGGSWSSSSSSDCWKKSSEKTCCKVESRLIGDPPPLAAVDMPISISPLSHPMNAAIFASQFPRNR